jgi:hypothetical protein
MDALKLSNEIHGSGFVDGAVRPTRVALSVLENVRILRHIDDDIVVDCKRSKWFPIGSSYNLPHYSYRLKQLELAYEDLTTVLRTDSQNQTILSSTKAAFGLDSSASKDFALTILRRQRFQAV